MMLFFLWPGRRRSGSTRCFNGRACDVFQGPSRQCVLPARRGRRDAREPETTACVVSSFLEEEHMPVILLWAIPTVIVIGGGGYWLMHLHH